MGIDGLKRARERGYGVFGKRIARYKKPGYVQFVDSLPKKEDGSIDRVKVKALYGSRG